MYQRTKVKKLSMFAKKQASNIEIQENAKSQEEIEEEQYHHSVPLFKKYPKLMNIPKVTLIKEPSRIRLMPNFAMKTGFKEIYVKRDDLLNDTYGGNKVRKLEFLLGYAQQKKVKVVHGIGNIGSNCCICLAAHARKFGIKPKVSLSEQPLTKEVQENLKLMGHFGAKMSLVKEEQIWQLHEQSLTQDPSAELKDTEELLIPVGASNILGTLGFVNAAFEVKNQIDCNDAKVPNLVFVPCSSLGTVAGLILGFALLGFKDTKIYGVEISKQVQDKRNKTVKLAMDTYKYMKEFDSDLPEINEQVLNDKLVLVSNFFGKGYGLPTKEGEAAKAMMKDMDFIELDTTYTGKTFAVIQYILDKKREMFEDKVVLFWNTKSSVNLSEELEDFHWEDDLPDEFHKYFNGDIEIIKEQVDSLDGDQDIKFE